MADLTKSNVRKIAEWTEGNTTGKRRACRRVEIYNVTVGGETNKIPASALEFSVIEESTIAYDRQDSAVVAAAPDQDGSNLFLYPGVDGATNPADVTINDTPNGLYLVVKGY